MRKPMSERQQWEYTTTVFQLDDKQKDIDGVLHEAGPMGWELVGVAPMKDKVVFVFKRPSGGG
jgi:hypothetical protein